MDKSFYSIGEAASLLGFSDRRLREFCQQGTIKAQRFGIKGKWLIPAGEIERVKKEGITPQSEIVQKAPHPETKGELDSLISKRRDEHFAHMAQIAELHLRNDVGKAIIISEESESPNTRYSIVSDTSGYYEIDRNELTRRLEENIDHIVEQYSSWDVFDCFGEHLDEELKSEYPEFTDYFDFLNSNPGKLVNVLRTLAQRKTFKGTCPVCKDLQ